MEKILDLITKIDAWGSGDTPRVCYIDGNDTLTYQELKKQSDALAFHFLKNPLKKGPVMVIGELEKEMLPTFIGLIKAGYSYIPVETTTPVERMEMIYEVAKPSGVIVVGNSEPTFLPITLKKDALLEIFAKNEVGENLPTRDVEDNFYMIFTSGTTGVPKGVPISHKNLLSFVNWELNAFPIRQDQRFLQQAPFSFDLSVMSLYPALAAGASLVTLKKEIVENFKVLFETLPKLDVNIWVSTPSFIDIVLMSKEFNEESLPQLETFLFCGEELVNKTAKKLQTAFPNANIYNTYGPTEATVAISQVLITPEILENYQRLPIGYVKEDTIVKIVDEKLKEVKSGDRGEILISGPNVTKGYYHNPEKTKEAFVKIDGVDYYRTKDSGYFKDDLLMYEGRLDFQIKLHGYRMELEDIDQNLMSLKNVEKACVVPKYVGDKVQSLVAFICLKEVDNEDSFSLIKELKQELGNKVMPYMVPQRFQILDQLPLTPNGKVDRKALTAQVNAKGGQA